MTKAEHEAVMAEIRELGSADKVADRVGISEVTLLRAMLGVPGTHPATVALVAQYARGRKEKAR